MVMVGLTPEQLLERRKGIGGSDAPKIARGEWYELWQDKTGRVPAKMVMSEWDSALRHCTEGLQLDWYEKVVGEPVTRRGEVVISKEYPFLRCTLDGFSTHAGIVIQAKHVSEFTKDPVNWCIEHYAAQLQHEMICTNAAGAILTMIHGLKEPVRIPFEPDEFWALDYVAKAQKFWWYVEHDTAPPDMPAAVAPAPPKEEWRTVDMTGKNEWANEAAKWLENQKAAKKFDKATDAIKKLIEADVGVATGHGIKVTRAKNRALSIKKADDDD